MTIAVKRPLVQAVTPDKEAVSSTRLFDDNAIWQSLDRRRFNACPGSAIQFHLFINLAGQNFFAVSIASAPRGKKCIVSVASAGGAGPMTVSRERLEVTIKRAELLDAEPPVALPPIVRAIPVQYRRSGFGIRMIIPSSGAAVVRRTNSNLLTLIHRGTKWFRRLVTEGCGPSMIAEEEKVSPALVQRMIYTAFLAPDIVKLIEAGEQPATLTSRTLMDALPLPPNWAEQRILFGIQASP